MGELLPNGWVETVLGEVTTKPQYGWTTKSTNIGKYKYLRTTDIGKGNIDWERVPFCQEVPNDIEKYLLKENDILISRAGSIGLSYLVERTVEDSLFASYLIRFKPYIVPKFIYYYLNSKNYWRSISDNAVGIAVQNINAPKLQSIPFPLPPLPEQERIVAKLDNLFAQHEKIKKALDKVPALLKAFRQQVLRQAVTGKLTEQWREGKDLEIDYKSINDYLKKFKRFKPVDLKAEVNEIPITWHNVKLGNVSFISNGSTPSRKIKEYWEGNIAWIGSGQIQNNKIRFAKEFITDRGLANSSTRILPKGTVLIAMIGEGKTRAQSSILEIQATINQNVASVEIGHNQIVPEYLQYFLIKNYALHRTIGNGTGPKALNCQRVREFDFQLPPQQEQEEIVRRVESLFTIADAVEARYEKLIEKIENLPQAILHKAFKGELVPQLSSDGDARDLLEEIFALKHAIKGKRRNQ